MTSTVNKNLKDIIEFYSAPPTADKSSDGGDFENGRIRVMFAAGPPFSLYEQSIAFLNSNATAILFPANGIDSFAVKITYDNAQEAYRKLNVANTLADRNEYKKAEEIYWESLKTFPTPEAYFKLSSLYLSYKHHDDVVSLCKRGLKTTRVILSGKDVYIDEFDIFALIYLNLSVALVEQGKIQEAKAVFLKAAAIDPNLIQKYKVSNHTVNHDQSQKNSWGNRKSTITNRKNKMFGMKLWQVIILGAMILILVLSFLSFVFYVNAF